MLTDYLRIDSPRCINTISAASRFTLKYICKELTAADSMYKHEKELAKELAEGRGNFDSNNGGLGDGFLRMRLKYT